MYEVAQFGPNLGRLCLMPHHGSPKMSVVEPLTGNLSHDALGVPSMTKR